MTYVRRGFVIALLGLSACYPPEGDPYPKGPSITRLTTTTAAPTTTTTTAPLGDVEVLRVSGTGNQALRPFTVTRAWEITVTSDALVQVWITWGGVVWDVVQTGIEGGTASGYQPRADTYLLDVVGTGEWELVVVEVGP